MAKVMQSIIGVVSNFDVEKEGYFSPPDYVRAIEKAGALAPEIVVSARANDEVVEAIEVPGRPFAIGAQWHAECMYESEPACRHLINNFATACSGIEREPGWPAPPTTRGESHAKAPVKL
ncbi:hypothetical protein EN885_32965 [Mesorhizobium sp. M6A.T.Cr.TU.014.01.1.1]|nr:gamma-glutamyl-gamma-aminobutyrate hydrolase family protein [Mesorhizobium sp. M6A.T.Cr.TU.014.01.1.1]RVB71092.1 hypothetical protein EN885_32965 [Mesorhizobium sp. M6A.T.Cr.TU.014.01.1.1]